jgi:hypothetical protein
LRDAAVISSSLFAASHRQRCRQSRLARYIAASARPMASVGDVPGDGELVAADGSRVPPGRNRHSCSLRQTSTVPAGVTPTTCSRDTGRSGGDWVVPRMRQSA